MEKNDWDINPQNYVTNEDGSFVLKKDGTPRKKAGRSKDARDAEHRTGNLCLD